MNQLRGATISVKYGCSINKGWLRRAMGWRSVIKGSQQQPDQVSDSCVSWTSALPPSSVGSKAFFEKRRVSSHPSIDPSSSTTKNRLTSATTETILLMMGKSRQSSLACVAKSTSTSQEWNFKSLKKLPIYVWYQRALDYLQCLSIF